jgi:hypothetical protein
LLEKIAMNDQHTLVENRKESRKSTLFNLKYEETSCISSGQDEIFFFSKTVQD